ncbi:type IV secretory system conjugative DNA transfer family protein [Dermatophilus congolensis]|uniref:type IV secretory system conjugative DNA transfer family protein n=1 Tax=Dermatophilus congolensis TaxID=1863 RepID=UPI001AAEC3C9|nr:type IV secretory system conjugative DNA transfer family protein [Dermatophilus congolensis]MBO3146359.1 type IV secretory system conjugative DNA transfer family protein [Dermatophilus congolensis]MBO3148598.1 type IV secretory system conjugative DNA transfer family protein [Dermatophilus congolensis]MBO3157596.1 type IV secretory system conjugative DNA transfer family protein [Dermatophilus congolensis]MBO3159876.1 type IV secretory system conjugative DNA transfer family protein [Dermatophi
MLTLAGVVTALLLVIVWLVAGLFSSRVLGLMVVAPVGILCAALLMFLVARYGNRFRPGHDLNALGLATRAEARAQSGEDLSRKKALYQRPSMTPEQVQAAPVSDLALSLGRSPHGVAMYAPMEDQVAVIGKTGAGKGAYYVAPSVISAPGPVVLTTTRADVIDVITSPRSRKGKIWVFDPLNVATWYEPMYWNPVAGAMHDTVARSRGRAFVAAVKTGTGGGNTDFFKQSAAGALQYLIHAAALEGLTMREVAQWGMRLDDGAETPRNIIRNSDHSHAEKLWADMLRALSTGADDTVASTRMTLRSALDPLSSGNVLKSLVPSPGCAEFNVHEFVDSQDTLVLISDSNSLTNVSPLTTMLLQEVIDVAKQVAASKPRNLLDPPLRIVGDEIANVAPLENLPEVVTDSRGYGIQWVNFFQSRTQPEAIWGKERAATFFNQSSFEILLPGIKDQATLDYYSASMGVIDVAESSVSLNPDYGLTSRNLTQQERRVMRPEEIRKLGGSGTALLFPSLGEPMMLQLTPWWETPDGKEWKEHAAKIAALRAAYGHKLTHEAA